MEPVRLSHAFTLCRLVAAWIALVAFGTAARAGLFAGQARDVDVITVTDVTAKGKAYRVPTPDQPIYYMMIDLGQKVIVSDMEHPGYWAGEKLPERGAARDWVIAGLAEQGYRPGDLAKNLPSQLLFFSWGMVRGGDTVTTNTDGSIGNPSQPALAFLGGEKAGVMWDRERIGTADARMLTRGFDRMGIKGKVLLFAGSNLFLGRVEAYTMDSLKAKTRTLLWETRFACLADGLTLVESLPMMIKAAAPNFCRETIQPVNLNATRTFGGSVRMDDLKILGDVPPLPDDFPDLPANIPDKSPKPEAKAAEK